MDTFKKLDKIKENLEKAKETITSYKDLEISDGDIVKYSKHGQWTLKESKKMKKELGGGSLQGSYGMIN